jgi:hypothetical protein
LRSRSRVRNCERRKRRRLIRRNWPTAVLAVCWINHVPSTTRGITTKSWESKFKRRSAGNRVRSTWLRRSIA